MRKLLAFLFAALMSVGMWAVTIVAVPNPSSSYKPTQIVNGSFESTPTMAGPKQNRIPNGTNQGWNTTENGDVCFEWMSSMQNHNSNLTPIGTYCVEMNADNSAALYQDLYTYGGDVIRWSLAHAVRTLHCGPAEQYMRVEVGAPLYNGNNIVYPTGVNNNINTNINPNTKATYRYNGITNPTGHTYGFNGQNLQNLKLNKSANAYQWYRATGVYIVPESQSVTRFAFVSEDNSSCGNLLDDISFSTLIGDLSATYGANNSVVIKGYWGETDTSKKLIININGTPNEVDMTSVRGQNFVITMTYDNNPTNIMIYHQDYVSATRTISIAKANPTVTAPTAKANLTYSGSAQALVNAGSTNGGTMKYSLDNSTWNTDIPTGTNAGSYTVYYKVEGNSNYNSNNGSNFQVTIAKANPTVTAPTAKANLTYSGSAQALVNAGSTNGGTMKYSLDNSTWNTDIPTGTNAGSYTVYYKVEGNSNYNSNNGSNFQVTIAKANPTVTAPTAKANLTYSGSAQALVNAGSTNGGTMKYSLDNSTWNTDIPTGTNAGSYTVYYKVEGNSNYNGNNGSNFQVTIAQSDQQKADAVIAQINAIGSPITAASQTAIDAARNAYDNLTDDQKALVGNLSTLTNAEAALAVVNLINAIDDPVVYTDACHQEILDAREAYNNLTQAQKDLIDASTLQKLTDAEDAYASLNVDITAKLDPEHPKVYYSTFYDGSRQMQLPADVEAYTATVDGDKMHLKKVAVPGDILPAATAVVLRAPQEDITLTPSDATPVSVENNDLLGTDVNMDVPSDHCYVLSGADGFVGFYPLSSPYTLTAHKAYIDLDNLPGGANIAPRRMRFVFSEEQTATGMENVQNEETKAQKVMIDGVMYIIRGEHMYDAQGQIVK